MSQTKAELVNGLSVNAALADAITVNSSGQVGIGDDSPDREFIVKNASSNATVKIEASNAHTSQLFFSDTDAEGVAKIAVFHGSGAGQNALNFETGGSSRLLIDSSGKIGIGTTSPAKKLEIQSTTTNDGVLLKSSSSNYLAFIGNTNRGTEGQSLVRFEGQWNDTAVSRISMLAGADTTNKDDGVIAFATASGGSMAEAMRIDSSGRLLAGRTSNISVGGDASDHCFEQLTNNGYALTVHSNQTNQRGIGLFYTTGKTPEAAFAFQIGGSFKTLIRDDGDLENANNSYGGISDVSLKENIVDANSQWDDIKNIKIRNYNFKASTGQPTYKQIGVIAQELETVCPNLVDVTRETGKKNVAYSVLYVKAVKALQEAMARIETLESDVAALKAA